MSRFAPHGILEAGYGSLEGPQGWSYWGPLVGMGALTGGIIAFGPEGVEVFIGSGSEGAAAEAGDHIVIGLSKQGLEDTASQLGGRTLMNQLDFRAAFIRAADDSSTEFTISLNGMRGATTEEQLQYAIEQGAYGGDRGFTNWKISLLSRAGRLGEATLVRNGEVIPNPYAAGAP